MGAPDKLPLPLVEAVRAIAQGPLADQAEAIDRGTYPRAVMQAPMPQTRRRLCPPLQA
jgi:hypothetical protein